MEEINPKATNTGRNAVLAVSDSMTADIILKALKLCDFGSVFIVDEFAQLRVAIEDACEPIDLVICDLRLSDGDAFQMISELSRRRFAGAIVLVSNTSSMMLNCAADLAESGGLRVIGTFERPLPVRRLIETIDQGLFGGVPAAKDCTSEINASVIARDIKNWNIEAVFQPKVSLATGDITGFEALARWNHPDYGLIPPAYFLARAEHSSMIDDLTIEMLTQSLRMLRTISTITPRARMSVNLSGRSLQDPTLPDRLFSLTEEHGVRPSQVVFEITETQIVRNRSSAVSSVNRLGLMGFGISLDDFGTGFSSLDRLKSMPFTELKVDRRFCHGASNREQLVHILRNCHDLARDLGLEIVAEGVEDDADLELVRKLDYDVVQGFCVSRPIRGADLMDWIEAYGFEQASGGLAA